MKAWGKVLLVLTKTQLKIPRLENIFWISLNFQCNIDFFAIYYQNILKIYQIYSAFANNISFLQQFFSFLERKIFGLPCWRQWCRYWQNRIMTSHSVKEISIGKVSKSSHDCVVITGSFIISNASATLSNEDTIARGFVRITGRGNTAGKWMSSHWLSGCYPGWTRILKYH